MPTPNPKPKTQKQAREALRVFALGDLYKPEHFAARGALSAAEVRYNVLTFT